MKKISWALIVVFAFLNFSIQVFATEYVPVTTAGQVVDSITYNGVTVDAIYTPWNNLGASYDENTTYCCAAFVKKFYSSVYGVTPYNLRSTTSIPSVSRGRFTETSYPRKGDIVRFNNEVHWAIVKEVNGNNITIIQQNAWWNKKTTAQVGAVISSANSAYSFFRYSLSTEDKGGSGGNESGKRQNISLNIPTSHNIKDNTAAVSVTINNPYRTRLGACGLFIGKSVDSMQQVSRETGAVNKIWYDDISAECGYSMEGGTTYYYKFYVEANGTTYYSDVQSFETTGGVKIPPAPRNVNLSAEKIAAGRNVEVSWDKVETADNYKITLKRGNTNIQEVTTSGLNYSFTLNDVGKYTVSVAAMNRAGTGEAKNSSSVEAMPKQKVTFQVIRDGIFLQSISDDDEDWPKIVSTQMVDWGTAAMTPTEPIREGYTFNGWNKDYSNITEETVITAQYRKRNYLVTFTDNDGTVLSSQRVDYGDAAAAPSDPTPPNGYTFVGWDSLAYQKVKGRTNINAVYAWADESHPVSMEMTSATRNDAGSGYEVTLNLTNIPTDPTKGRIIVNLKTQEGKMVANAIEEITLSASETVKDKKLFVSYDGVATIAEAELVGVIDSNKTGVPLANTVSSDIDLSTKWSDWTTTQVTGDYETESRTEYRHSDRSTTTSSSKSLAGWSLLKETSQWGNWSGYSQTPAYASATRQVDSYYVQPQYKTQWQYSGYYNPSTTYSTHCAACGGSLHRGSTWFCTEWLDYQVGTTGKTFWCPNVGTVTEYYAWTPTFGNKKLYTVNTRQVETSPGYTMYRYRDLNYTYYFDKWSNYSDWSTEPVTANENREVETRTTYRYKAKDITADMEDKTGEARVISGTVDKDVAGKQAVLMVYKKTNSDPTESQMEYIGETIIGENGEYSFNCVMREEPTAETGDFIAVLGIEGGVRPIYIETIKAPTAVYTVQFTDADWNVVSTQQVEAGGSANAPEPAAVEGASFGRWNEDYTNVNEDLIINPEYSSDKHTVIYLDRNDNYLGSQLYNHGDTLIPSTYFADEGGVDNIKWDALENGVTSVTDNMVVKEVYERPTYTVTFRNINGDEIISEKIKEGDAALVPTPPSVEGMIFDKWSGDMAYTSVYDDLDIYPIYKYENTVEKPVITTTTNNNGKVLITLSSATENADIYYTTDSTYPLDADSENTSENGSEIVGIKYTEPFEVDSDTVISAVATAENMNSSDLAVRLEEVQGDIDGNGALKAKDIVLMKQRLAWEREGMSDWTDEYERRADVNKDGSVNGKDLVLLLQIAAAME